jgi:hypothetical protein
LTAHEFWIAAQVGAARQCKNLLKGRQDRYGFAGDGWEAQITGACGEAALAKMLGQWWSGNMDKLGLADVGKLQVRTTPRDDGRLIVHPEDDDDHVFVLVTGVAPRLDVRGWIVCADAKLDEYWTDPKTGRPAFFVPQSVLRPVGELAA